MRYRIFKALEEFVCTGAECEDTCCKGWKIGIDRESYGLYRGVKGRFGRRLLLGIDHRKRCFRLRGTACSFLNREGLCDIYRELGRDGLCRECRAYPRHVEDYGNVREVMLSLSCPEAARVILEDQTQGEWVERKGKDVCDRKTGKRETDWVDEILLKELEKVREVMADLLRDPTVEWGQRLIMVLALARDIQRYWDGIGRKGNLALERDGGARESCMAAFGGKGELGEGIKGIVEKYQTGERAEAFFNRSRRGNCGSDTERMIRMAAWMRLTGEWEPVLPGWHKKLNRMCRCLYHGQSVEDYGKLCRTFDWKAKAFEREWENLALYFVNTYLLGAVYDRDVYGKAKLIVFSVRIIREWCLFRYMVTGKISGEEMAKAAYRYSREMENSDGNFELLERELGRNPLFGMGGMVKVLVNGDSSG